MTAWLTDAQLTHWSYLILHVSAVGQTLFVLIWVTLPFYRSWIGRALFVKSVSLAIYLDFAEVVYWWGPLPDQLLLGVLLFGLIAVGIWSQVVAIVHEVWRGYRARREETDRADSSRR